MVGIEITRTITVETAAERKELINRLASKKSSLDIRKELERIKNTPQIATFEHKKE